MSPKSLLRHPQAQSSFDEVGPGTHFRPLIPDGLVPAESVQKVLLCTGKVYYDLVAERKAKGLEDKIAIARVEQLCPFPYYLLKQEVGRYPKSKVRILCTARVVL